MITIAFTIEMVHERYSYFLSQQYPHTSIQLVVRRKMVLIVPSTASLKEIIFFKNEFLYKNQVLYCHAHHFSALNVPAACSIIYAI